jgi:hypothetical protein
MDYESYFSGRLEQLLGEARVDNRKISKMRQNHAKTLRCKRCLVLAAPWIRSQSIRKGQRRSTLFRIASCDSVRLDKE